MLRAEGVNSKGQRIELSSLVKMVMKASGDTPADSFEVTFEGEIKEELAYLHIYNAEELVFEGVCDEQICSVTDTVTTQIAGRSLASVLLDNEAMPRSFQNPTFEVIFRKYLEPLGFEDFRGENLKIKGEFKVTKGMSCYKVLEEFLKKAGARVPHIRGRVIDFAPDKGEASAEFSDKETAGAYRYRGFKETLKRCELLSEIRVRTGEDSRYAVTVKDEDAVSRGIKRIRYLNASMQGGAYRQTAENMIKNARRRERTVELLCEGLIFNTLSQPAIVTRGDRVYGNLCVRELKCTFLKNVVNTRVILESL